MNKIGKSHNLLPELRKVDPQSGKLRSLLIIIIVIIAWITLALVASLTNPIHTMQLFGANTNQSDSATLASSLLDEILGSFFSPYTVLYLIIILLSIQASFVLIRTAFNRVMQFNGKKILGKYLKSSAFNRPSYPEVDAQEKNFEKSTDYKLLTSLGGPAYLTIGREHIAMVVSSAANSVDSQKSGIDTLTADHDEPSTFFLEHGSQLKCLLSNKEKQLLLKTHVRLNEGRSVEFHGVRLTYNWNTTNLINDDNKSNLLRSQVAVFVQNPDWESMLENLIQSEFGSLIARFSGAEILDIIDSLSLQSEAKEQVPVYYSDKTHNIRKHGRAYRFSRNLTSQPNGGTILRNRRRSIQPEMHAKVEPIEDTKTTEPESKTVNTLSKQLFSAVNTLFIEQVININIEEIGKVSFNGVH